MTLFIFFLVLLKSKREGKKLSGTLRMRIYRQREKNIIEREKEISLSCLFRDIYDRDMHNLNGKHHLLGALTESKQKNT